MEYGTNWFIQEHLGRIEHAERVTSCLPKTGSFRRGRRTLPMVLTRLVWFRRRSVDG